MSKVCLPIIDGMEFIMKTSTLKVLRNHTLLSEVTMLWGITARVNIQLQTQQYHRLTMLNMITTKNQTTKYSISNNTLKKHFNFPTIDLDWVFKVKGGRNSTTSPCQGVCQIEPSKQTCQSPTWMFHLNPSYSYLKKYCRYTCSENHIVNVHIFPYNSLQPSKSIILPKPSMCEINIQPLEYWIHNYGHKIGIELKNSSIQLCHKDTK